MSSGKADRSGAGISLGDKGMMRANNSGGNVGEQPLVPLFRWLYASLIMLIGLGLAATPAQAQYATGGSGIYRNQIIWFDWGTNGANIPASTPRPT